MFHPSDLISTHIDAYLAEYDGQDMLRFLTCGNVDDSKSTLIGRLLHDYSVDDIHAVLKNNGLIH